MPKVTGALTKYPARASCAWYVGLIAVGAMVLTLPFCRQSGKPRITVLDAVFTATSAACVTGLAVRSTGQDFSPLGQLTILMLIQLGGIGIMTVTTFVTFRLGGGESLRHRAVLAETLGATAEPDLRWVLRKVMLMTFAIEGAGFVLLAIRNLFNQPPGTALWHALFHSVSAFCNAGFGLYDDSLTKYQGDPLVNFTIMALIITGGIGFPVMFDLQRNASRDWRRMWDRLHMHTKLMLIGTSGLIAFGTVAMLILEWDDSLKPLPLGNKLLAALFQSVTCRTAGFNTLDIGGLTNASLFIMMLLMIIGAGPCSTGGGFKVSTFMAFMIRAWATFQGHTRVNIFRRTIPIEVFARATTTVFLFGIVSILALTVLLVFEQSSGGHPNSDKLFLDAMFEVVSALGTVGLSTGMTAQLSSAGRIIIIMLMFFGRLGPISVFIALSSEDREHPIEYPQEEPIIG